MNKLLNDDVFKADIKGKSESLQGMNDGQLQAFMRYKMKDGGFKIQEFRKRTAEDQLEYIQEALKEDFIKEKTTGPGMGSRDATPADIKYFADQGVELGEDERVYYQITGTNLVNKSTKNDGKYTKTQVANSAKVNKNWTKNESVLKKVFNSLTVPGSTQPPVKKVMADFAQANIAAMPIYGEDDQLIGYELKNQLVSTKPAQILLNESSESINQAIKVASGLSYSIGTEWGDLMSDDFSMFEE